MFTSLSPYEESIVISLIISATFSVLVGLVSLVWWLSKQFSSVRHLVYDKIEKVYEKIDESMKDISNKLEYHEQHDDRRFSQISNDLWTTRVRNAARDKKIQELEIDNVMSKENGQ